MNHYFNSVYKDEAKMISNILPVFYVIGRFYFKCYLTFQIVFTSMI